MKFSLADLKRAMLSLQEREQAPPIQPVVVNVDLSSIAHALEPLDKMYKNSARISPGGG